MSELFDLARIIFPFILGFSSILVLQWWNNRSMRKKLSRILSEEIEVIRASALGSIELNQGNIDKAKKYLNDPNFHYVPVIASGEFPKHVYERMSGEFALLDTPTLDKVMLLYRQAYFAEEQRTKNMYFYNAWDELRKSFVNRRPTKQESIYWKEKAMGAIVEASAYLERCKNISVFADEAIGKLEKISGVEVKRIDSKSSRTVRGSMSSRS